MLKWKRKWNIKIALIGATKRKNNKNLLSYIDLFCWLGVYVYMAISTPTHYYLYHCDPNWFAFNYWLSETYTYISGTCANIPVFHSANLFDKVYDYNFFFSSCYFVDRKFNLIFAESWIGWCELLTFFSF